MITCDEPSFCGRRTQFCVIPQSGSARSNLHGVNWHEYDAALFDLDGVLTPTAEVHMRAWQQLFADFLARRGLDQPYVESDYFDYIDGKPRYDGIRAFLASRGIQLAEGAPATALKTRLSVDSPIARMNSLSGCCVRRACGLRRVGAAT